MGRPVAIPESELINFGYEALQGGHVERALELFQRAVHDAPHSANAFDSLAEALEKAGRHSEAVAAVTTAKTLASSTSHPLRPSIEQHANALTKPKTE